MSSGTVRVLVEAARSSTGHLTGSVTGPEGDKHTFFGTLELLACIETAIDPDLPRKPPTTD